MKVLSINTSQDIGGAAIAAHRIASAVSREGDIEVLFANRTTKKNFYLERGSIWACNLFSKDNLFSVDFANFGEDITKTKAFKDADIIHLHWINQGFISIRGLGRMLSFGKPIVWTMHDMWPCTGICHHSRECDNYFSRCNNCQYLKFPGEHDASSTVFNRKKKVYSNASISFIACSNWLKNRAGHSPLLEGHSLTNIPNPIDTDFFKPTVRQKEPGPFKVLFGSAKITDKRKGIDYFVEACKILRSRHPELDIEIICYGSNSDVLSSMIEYPVLSMGYISGDAAIRDLYNSVDLFVTPSLEDNLPNTIMEAMSCGIPCVGFNIGGIPEMIDHKKSGYVANYKSAEDFAEGIIWALDSVRYNQLADASRQKVIDTYSEGIVAKQYISVYHSLLEKQ